MAFSEEEHRAAAALLLVERILHLMDGRFEEKGYQVFIGAL